MSEIPSELRYLDSHEWVRLEEDGTVTIGITDHAQQAIGDVVFVELPELDAVLAAGDEAGTVESVKAVSEIYIPLTGEIIAVNNELSQDPEIVNRDPYNDGWFFKMKLEDDSDLNDLMDAEAYTEYVEATA